MDAVKTGALIAQARKERELTQKELAERLHVSAQAVSKWERGLSCPDIGLLEPLAEALGITVTELLSGQRGEEPKEELVRDSLRFGLNQLGRKIRQWKWLFVLAVAVLAAVVAGLGYRWVREETEWFPQPETVVRELRTSDQERQIAEALGSSNSLHLYELTLADDLTECSVQAELWTHDGLERTWELMYASVGGIAPRDGMETGQTRVGAEGWAPFAPRRQILVLSVELEHEWSESEQRVTERSFDIGLSFAGVSVRGTIDGISNPNIERSVAWFAMDESQNVDREEGTVLLAMTVGGPNDTPNVLPPGNERTVQLVIRLFCK